MALESSEPPQKAFAWRLEEKTNKDHEEKQKNISNKTNRTNKTNIEKPAKHFSGLKKCKTLVWNFKLENAI